jgi:Uma2 family endonuclease
MTVKRVITAEEFFQMPDPPDGSRQELVRGEIVVMPPAGGLHGVCCSRVDRRVGNFVDDNKMGHVTANDTGFVTEKDPDSVRGPDIAFWSKERLPEVPVGYITIAPDLAVEVLSPSNTFKLIREKFQEYFDRGVQMSMGRLARRSHRRRLPLGGPRPDLSRAGHDLRRGRPSRLFLQCQRSPALTVSDG